jgi:hypothetical protein
MTSHDQKETGRKTARLQAQNMRRDPTPVRSQRRISDEENLKCAKVLR